MHAPQEKPVRLFYALWPDEATRAALAQWQSKVQGRKTAPEDFHITLAFLGAQPAALVPGLQALLARLPTLAKLRDITLVFDKIGSFGRNRIVWAGMNNVPPALLALQQALIQELSRQQHVLDSQSPFKPHITLAREAQVPADLPGDMTATPIVWHANQIALVQSSALAQGGRYQILASHWLDNNAAAPL